MKNISINILCFALPFIVGCSTVNANTPTKTWGGSMNKKTQAKVETFSQLDSASQEVRPKWLRITPKAIDGYYFVGMSSKRTEPRDARNESFNDALIGFARYCGLNVQYLAEHRDRSVGGNGGLIDTWTEGNTIAKMQAEIHLGNVTTEDRYTEKYSTFYGGSFMGHTYVDSSLVFVPTEEMELCKEHTTQANTFIAKKAIEVNTLTAKNESLQSENKLLKKQNTNLTNVALNQAQNSSKFFKQVLNEPVAEKQTVSKKEEDKEPVVTAKNTENTCKIICNGLVAYYPFNGDAIDESGNGNNGKIFGAKLTRDRNGTQNQAYRFTGKRNSYISIPKLGVENGDFTIATIVKANKKPIDQRSLNKLGNGKWVDSGIIWANGRSSYTGLRYHFYKEGNQNIWFVATKSPLIHKASGVYNPLQYTFLTGVVNKSEKTLSVYVDGKLGGKKQWNGNLNMSSINSWIIGGRGPMTDRYHKGFNGDIDEVRIYNRALSPDEIKTLYRGNSTELASL